MKKELPIQDNDTDLVMRHHLITLATFFAHLLEHSNKWVMRRETVHGEPNKTDYYTLTIYSSTPEILFGLPAKLENMLMELHRLGQWTMNDDGFRDVADRDDIVTNIMKIHRVPPFPLPFDLFYDDHKVDLEAAFDFWCSQNPKINDISVRIHNWYDEVRRSNGYEVPQLTQIGERPHRHPGIRVEESPTLYVTSKAMGYHRLTSKECFRYGFGPPQSIFFSR